MDFKTWIWKLGTPPDHWFQGGRDDRLSIHTDLLLQSPLHPFLPSVSSLQTTRPFLAIMTMIMTGRPRLLMNLQVRLLHLQLSYLPRQLYPIPIHHPIIRSSPSSACSGREGARKVKRKGKGERRGRDLPNLGPSSIAVNAFRDLSSLTSPMISQYPSERCISYIRQLSPDAITIPISVSVSVSDWPNPVLRRSLLCRECRDSLWRDVIRPMVVSSSSPHGL